MAFFFITQSCGNASTKANQKFDWQGHRGARGQVPENSIPSLQRALQDGVQTLEFDVVITQDSLVILSHEPWLNAQICQDSSGGNLEDKPEAYNIFKMTLAEVQQFDCGLKTHPDFPAQEKYSVQKPTLIDAIQACEEAAVMMNRDLPKYNIEIKSRPEWEGVFHPGYRVYTELVLEVLKLAQIEERTTLQSFDERVLQYLKGQYPEQKISLLVAADENKTVAEKIDALGFYPDVYSCEASLVTQDMLTSLHAQKVEVIPWTVNEIEEAKRLIDLGVDGIITDYPGRLIPALGSGSLSGEE